MTKDEVMMIVDAATHPQCLTPQQAVKFLEELAADIAGRLDALREDAGEE